MLKSQDRGVKLAVFVFVALGLCSGCATVSHLNQTVQADQAPALPSANSSADPQAQTHAISVVAPAVMNTPAMPKALANLSATVTPDTRPRDWFFDDEANPLRLDLNANADLIVASAASPEDGDSSSSPPFNPFSKAYVGLVWDDIKATFTAPTQWTLRDWLVFGGVAASVGTVAVFDKDIQEAVQRNRNPTVDDAFKVVQEFGNSYAPGVIGAFYLGGLVFNDPQAKSVALDAASASIIASGLVLYPLKYVVGRARPGDNLGAYHFKPFSGSDSFPSGHTTEAFALATVISEHYHSLLIDFGCYGIASAVGYARLDLNYHWASDVLTGAAIGTFVGHVVVHVNHNRWGVTVQPVIGPTMKGAQLSWAF